MIIHSLSNAEYHARPEVSSSQLKTLLRSPAHFWSEFLDPERQQKEVTDSMLIGTVVHTIVLEPHLFDSQYLVTPPCDRRTREGRAVWADFQSRLGGRIQLSDKNYTTAWRVGRAMKGHQIFDLMQSGGFFESSIFFTDQATGLGCRVRPDWHMPPCEDWPEGAIVDLKSTDDARPPSFSRHSLAMGYDTSASFYINGFMAHYGTTSPPPFLFLVGERNPPSPCQGYEASQEFIDKGDEKYRRALALLAECKTTNQWPGYDSGIQLLNLPKWA